MDSFLIIGLGNPGEKYQNTRHNIGFRVLDSLVGGFNSAEIAPFSLNKKIGGELTTIGEKEKIYLLKPQSFMNLSGIPTIAAMNYFNINIEKIVVVHDDIDLPLGQIRLSKNSSSGGHNGIKSIIEHLGSRDFVRLRVGISTKLLNAGITTEKFVLGKFSAEENIELAKVIDSSCECLMYYLENGSEKTMNKFNQKAD